MDEIFSSNSVMRAYCRISTLVDEIHDAHLHFSPHFLDFGSFRNEIKLLHRGILTLLAVINVPLHEFICLGLRISEEGWETPPLTTQAAIQEVKRIIEAMDTFINLQNGRQRVPDYDPIFSIDFSNAIISIRNLYSEEEEFDFSLLGNMLGATPEQINGLPVHAATEEDTDRACRICFESFVVDEELKILPCSHRFHKKCAERWLENNATCPLDRSGVFGT